MPAVRSAVVLVFDRLPAAMLGPYGATWCDTPACNRLAAEGYLAEQCWSDSDCLESLYRSYWSGWHAAAHSRIELRSPSDDGIGPSFRAMPLPQRLTTAGLYTELITDDVTVANHRWAGAFDDRLVFPHEGAPVTAENAGSMRVAQLLAAAAERLDSLTRPTLLWIHASAWNDAWDAPFEFRRQWADEEDPAPLDFVAPPSKLFQGRADPDELLGYLQAYVGQLAAWDACLEAWSEAFAASPLADDSLLLVTSPRGYPLGEHGVVGDAESRLYSELLHVPCFLRLPQTPFPLIRDQSLIQPADLYPTLVEWCCGSEGESSELAANPEASSINAALRGKSFLGRAMVANEGANDVLHDYAAAVSTRQMTVISPSWLLRVVSPDDNAPADDENAAVEVRELYAKPDDRWEANEVGTRCPEPLEELTAVACDRYGLSRSMVPRS